MDKKIEGLKNAASKLIETGFYFGIIAFGLWVIGGVSPYIALNNVGIVLIRILAFISFTYMVFGLSKYQSYKELTKDEEVEVQ